MNRIDTEFDQLNIFSMSVWNELFHYDIHNLNTPHAGRSSSRSKLLKLK